MKCIDGCGAAGDSEDGDPGGGDPGGGDPDESPAGSGPGNSGSSVGIEEIVSTGQENGFTTPYVSGNIIAISSGSVGAPSGGSESVALDEIIVTAPRRPTVALPIMHSPIPYWYLFPGPNNPYFSVYIDGALQQSNSRRDRFGKMVACAGAAVWQNKTGLALDAAGWAANAAFPEASVASTVVGSTLGVAGIAGAVIDNNGPADAFASGSIAFAGKEAAVANGMLVGAGSAIAGRIGVGALVLSSGYDLAKTGAAYNSCMAGQGGD